MTRHIVTLSSHELRICAWVGKMRRRAAIGNNRDPGLGPSSIDRENADNDIRGAEAELATSIGLNLYWRPTIGSIRDRDVGGLVESRSTVLASGRLIIKPRDNDTSPFVLVHKVSEHVFRLIGWYYARDAKSTELKSYGKDPAHYIEQSKLHDLDELIILVHKGIVTRLSSKTEVA